MIQDKTGGVGGVLGGKKRHNSKITFFAEVFGCA